MKKSNTNIVSITHCGIFWQDKNLQTRSMINATIENVNLSFLHLKIFACNVARTDEATYFCDISAIKEDCSVILRSSNEISLNITGKSFITVKRYMNIISTMLKTSEARQKLR